MLCPSVVCERIVAFQLFCSYAKESKCGSLLLQLRNKRILLKEIALVRCVLEIDEPISFILN